MAKGVKPPKSLCLQSVQPDGPVLVLGIKKGNKLIGPGGKFEMYTVQGLYMPRAIFGTGYMHLNYFALNISTSTGSTSYDISGAWDVVNETGTLDVNEISDSGFVSYDYDLQSVPCDEL